VGCLEGSSSGAADYSCDSWQWESSDCGAGPSGPSTSAPTAAPTDNPICYEMGDILSEAGCSCESGDTRYSAKATCTATLPLPIVGDQTASVEVDISPCAEAASATLTVRMDGYTLDEKELGAGHDETIPIPGVSWDIGVAAVGAFAIATIEGSMSSVTLKAGLTVCAELAFVGEKCGGDIPLIDDVFPVWVLQGTWDFTGACTAPPPPSPPPPPSYDPSGGGGGGGGGWDSGGSSNTGMIIGAAAGGLAGVGLLIALFFYSKARSSVSSGASTEELPEHVTTVLAVNDEAKQ